MIGQVSDMLRRREVRLILALLLGAMAVADLTLHPSQSIGMVWDMAFAAMIVLFLASLFLEIRARQATN